METLFKTLNSKNPKLRVDIMKRDDSLFSFIELTYVDESGGVWTPTHFSGLYEDAALAECEAKAWLQTREK